jgi:hypothetical protein
LAEVDMTETEILRIQFLDWLYDVGSERPSEQAKVVDFLGDDEPDHQTETVWRGILRELDSDGLIRLAETMGFGGTSATLTGAGRGDVEARRKRRQNPARRNAAGRDAVVRWVYAHPKAPDLSPMVTDPDSFYEGQPFDLPDFDAALKYLLAKGLVTGQDVAEFVLLHAELTDKGIDCAENFGGSVSDYLRRSEDGGGTTNVNFHGPVSGAIALGNRDVTQTVTSTGIAADELVVLVRAIAEAVSVLGLSEEDASTIASDAQIIEGELVHEKPDAGVVRTFMGRILAKLGNAAASSALALVLTAYVKELMRKVGIPIDE